MNYLSSKSLETVLPDYDQVFRIIQDIRGTAQKNSYEMEEYEHIPYRNVVSIWGERGSGKTSVFMTLRNVLMGNSTDSGYVEMEELKIERKGDCHLSLIVPEMLEEGTDLLGVILLKIKKEIEKKKKEHPEVDTGEDRHEQFESCIYKKKDELDTLWDEAFATYLMRAEGYNSIASKNYTNFYDYSKQREESLRSEINLREKIYKLFTKISERFRNKNEKSLIFVYIDDADINRQRCAETVNTILRYLKHPNVVVFLSGDKDKMERELLWYELKDESILPKCSNELMESVKATKKQYVYDLLKKVVPYSGRFNLQKLKNAKKKDLIYPAKKGEKTEEKEKFGSALQTLFKLDEGNFSKLVPDSVFGIFDYKPRGIITVWDYIRNEFPNESKIKASSLLSFLDKIIITNDNLKDHEKLINDCIDIIQENESCKCIINYEMFRYYVYSKVQSVEVENSETEKKKQLMQEQMVDVLQLFYFMEKLVKYNSANYEKGKFELKNDDELGVKYAELMNAILDIKDERRVYYNALTSVEVITLYNALSSVLSLKQQAEIYKNKELFEKYNTVLKEIEFKPLENVNDYEWKQALDRESELQNNTSREIVSKVLQAFQGVKFDLGILDDQEKNEEQKDLQVVNAEEESSKSEIDKDFKADTELEKKVERLITKRKAETIIQNIIKKENPELECFKIEKVENPKKTEKFELRMQSLLNENFLQSIKYYIEPDDDIFMSNCRNELDKYCKRKDNSNLSLKDLPWNANIVVRILNIIQLAAIKRRKELEELDFLVCANILNKLKDKKNPIQIYIHKDLSKYLQILVKHDGEKEKKNRAEELVENLFSSCNVCTDSTTRRIISTNILRVFEEKDHEKEGNGGEHNPNIAGYIDEGGKEKNAWTTRRRNTLFSLIRILEDVYIEHNCNELLHDFAFINCIEMLNVPFDKNNKYQYKDIQTYINEKVNYFSENKNYYFIQQGISFVKEQVIKAQEYYKIHEINLDSLDTIIQKSDSVDIRTEAETMKQRLLAQGKINTQIFDEFVERLEFYYKNRLDKDNSFHVNTLKMLCDKLINKDVPIDCAEKLIDVEKEERKRIYQLELNSYVRAYKNYLEQKEREEQEEKKLDKNAQNESQEAQTDNDETDN